MIRLYITSLGMRPSATVKTGLWQRCVERSYFLRRLFSARYDLFAFNDILYCFSPTLEAKSEDNYIFGYKIVNAKSKFRGPHLNPPVRILRFPSFFAFIFRFIYFHFIILLPEGLASEAWKPSNKVMLCVPPTPKLEFDYCFSLHPHSSFSFSFCLTLSSLLLPLSLSKYLDSFQDPKFLLHTSHTAILI